MTSSIHLARGHSFGGLTHFPLDKMASISQLIFKGIFINEKFCISIRITLKFVHNGPIDNIPALVQIMAWRRPGDKLLSEPMLTQFTTHICDTRGGRVKPRHHTHLYREMMEMVCQPGETGNDMDIHHRRHFVDGYFLGGGGGWGVGVGGGGGGWWGGVGVEVGWWALGKTDVLFLKFNENAPNRGLAPTKSMSNR